MVATPSATHSFKRVANFVRYFEWMGCQRCHFQRKWLYCREWTASDVPSIIFFIISCKILCKNPFNFFFHFLITLHKIKIKIFECPKTKPATHCFIFNLPKWYLDHLTLGQLDDRLSNPAYYIEDCRIFDPLLAGLV